MTSIEQHFGRDHERGPYLNGLGHGIIYELFEVTFVKGFLSYIVSALYLKLKCYNDCKIQGDHLIENTLLLTFT